MARETVAQRNVRYAQEHEAHLAQQVTEYPVRLMAVLARATKARFELAVKDNEFLVRDRNRHETAVHSLAYAHSADSQYELEELECEVNRYERELAEATRLREVKAEALRKVNEVLTQEERKLLNLQ